MCVLEVPELHALNCSFFPQKARTRLTTVIAIDRAKIGNLRPKIGDM